MAGKERSGVTGWSTARLHPGYM